MKFDQSFYDFLARLLSFYWYSYLFISITIRQRSITSNITFFYFNLLVPLADILTLNTLGATLSRECDELVIRLAGLV